MGGVRAVSAAARQIAQLVADLPPGISRRELAAEATGRFPGLPEQRLAKLITEAVAGGLLREDDDRLIPVVQPEVLVNAKPLTNAARPLDNGAEGRDVTGAVEAPSRPPVLRAIALDIESVVRTTTTAPYVQRHVYDVAAIRCGADREWVAAGPRWQRYLRFPGDDEQLRDAAVRDAVLDRGIPARQAWTELRNFLADADVVMAHNGTGLDFPVVEQAAADAGADDPLASVRLVDTLYLAHAVWPTAPSHRLQDLAPMPTPAEAELRTHTAEGDATLLVDLLRRAAADFSGRATELRALVSDVCPDSDAWRLLREITEETRATPPEPLVWEQVHVARLLGAEVAHHPPRRNADGRMPGRGAVVVPDALRGPDGRVDPTALARAVHGPHVEPRSAQQRMTMTLHQWTDAGVSGLLEAPTGTGKSYAILAAALDWLAGAPGRTAVIATYTKQLQSQMAKDVQDLERALPGVLGVTDLVN